MMVQVRDTYPLTEDGALDIRAWIKRIGIERSDDAIKKLCKSCELCMMAHSDVLTSEGNSAFEQGLATAEILAHLQMDTDTICAAILFAFVRAKEVKLAEISENICNSVALLIQGALKMDAIRSLHQNSKRASLSAGQVERLRKMLMAMVDDPRVILLKLAEQVCILREAKNSTEENRVLVAQETVDIYAPLANRLGIGQLKWELEDLSFRYLHPAEYKKIALHLAERRIDRDNYISRVMEKLHQEMNKLNVHAEITGRAKHIFSIWKKMQRKNVGFEEIYDVRAIRIIVNNINECYMALGAVHGLWQHIPKEFDDYIATPKENGYRSLHTAVIGPESKHLEVQIRTHEMHQESELGVAAHWLYKEGGGNEQPGTGFEGKINWLRSLLDWQQGIAEEGDILEDFKNRVVEDRVYVFTPDGAVIDLPYGATAVDFAYNVHTEVGHRCRGAKADGRIIPLTHPLSTGQTIEVITAKNSEPSRDWLNPHRGYVKSNRARSKIHQWFKRQDRDKNIAEGKHLIETEIEREGIDCPSFKAVYEHFNFHNEEELFAAIGAGDIGLHTALNVIHKLYSKPELVESEHIRLPPLKKKKVDSKSDDIHIQGVGNLMTQMAGCCHPIVGDQIIGYVSQGRGVIVHRLDCKNVIKGKQDNPERYIEVDWGGETQSHYPAELAIHAYDRKGLLKDITTLLANEKVNVTGLHTNVNRKNHTTDISLQIEVESLEGMEELLTKLQNLPNVVGVKRR